ncbi:DUF1049 domain-containing protein [Erythrobacter sp. KY5]|uniref:LapA family protein n=1 Tax=Erythrobacter sp. KY5 TaxID=2011159 RepID=UPI000DBF2C35|nr:LapA family protein [Erythrobacter sp. KY5]AWW75047.1 DUF1049 domain-containing protein [Erythrobacter sp. KY5]
MQIVRTILWVLLAIFIVVFVMLNYGEPQRVRIWLSEDPVGFDWPVGIIALVFWLLGVIPTWLYHRSVKWSLGRRIRSLENSIKSNALSQRHQPDATVDKPADIPAEPGDTFAPTQSSAQKDDTAE